jgi:hypothetical protein
MFNAWFIIILFFLGGATGILGWLTDFAPYYSFATSSKSAIATAASKTQKPGDVTTYLGELRYQFPLRFRTESGNEVVSSSYYKNTYVPRRALNILERDGHVTVLYLPDDPQRVLFEGDIQNLPLGFHSLALGLASLVIGAVLIPRRYQLARYARYIGHSDGLGDE